MGFITIDNAVKIGLLLLILIVIYYVINIGDRYVVENSEIGLTKKKVRNIFLSIIFAAIIYLLWTNVPVIGSVLTILLASLVFAYLISPLVKYFEDKLEEKNISKAWSVIIVYGIIIGVIALLLGLIIPGLGKEFAKFFNYIPNLVIAVSNFIDSLVERFSSGQTAINIDLMVSEAENFFTRFISGIQANILEMIANLPDRIPNIISVVVVIAMTPIVAFYLLKDRQVLLTRVRKFLVKHDKYRLMNLFKDLDAVMSDYVRGRLLMSAFAGVATTIVMFVLRIDFAVVVGIITGIADIIPYIGPVIGFIPAVILAAIDSPVKAIIMALSFAFIQWLENNVVGPVILSDRVGLHPVVILFSIFIGGSIGGLLGMIFLTPIVVALKVVVKHFEPEIKDFINKIINK